MGKEEVLECKFQKIAHVVLGGVKLVLTPLMHLPCILRFAVLVPAEGREIQKFLLLPGLSGFLLNSNQ